MTRWIAIFEDKPETEAGWIRKEHLAAHFAYLAANKDIILIAGGLRPEPGAWITGSVWVIEAESRASATAMCEHDPFYKLGLRRGYTLSVWGKAPCFESVLL